jgi:ribosome biogenesis GTPase
MQPKRTGALPQLQPRRRPDPRMPRHASLINSSAQSDLAHGTVIAVHGRQLLVDVEGDADSPRQAFARGRRNDACVGDKVHLSLLGRQQAAVEAIEPRSNLMQRSDGGRSKSLAANIGLAAMVVAGEPPFSEELLMRVLAVADTESIDSLIIASKCDLDDSTTRIEPRLRLYESLGYRVIRLSAKGEPEDALASLLPLLSGRSTLLLGQSGMGKSTLVNLLVPDADLATQEISAALSSGRHTTSFCRMFTQSERLPDGTALIDSPGFQLFGIAHLSRSQLMHALPDFRPLIGQCRFSNCLHRDEPGCAVRHAIESGHIDARRHQLYLRMLEETLS